MSNEEYRRDELLGGLGLCLLIGGCIILGYLIITGGFSPEPSFKEKDKVCVIGLDNKEVFIRHTYCGHFLKECSYKVLFSQGGSAKMYDSELERCEEK
jgi:hypothetical protein